MAELRQERSIASSILLECVNVGLSKCHLDGTNISTASDSDRGVKTRDNQRRIEIQISLHCHVCTGRNHDAGTTNTCVRSPANH